MKSSHRLAASRHWISAALLTIATAPLVSAQEAQPAEPALARTMNDADIAWGPCPPFLPQGCGLAVLHGDAAKPNSDVFLRIPGGAPLPMHWHSSAERMILVAGELRVTYQGQPEAVLKAGSYAYGPAKRPHEGVCASDEACVLFIAFEGPVDAVPGLPGDAAH
jgi:mannose-6-phosphate isomerase-like protein (cupin superfamily)